MDRCDVCEMWAGRVAEVATVPWAQRLPDMLEKRGVVGAATLDVGHCKVSGTVAQAVEMRKSGTGCGNVVQTGLGIPGVKGELGRCGKALQRVPAVRSDCAYSPVSSSQVHSVSK